ncbi:MAG: hypothetical protein Fur0041_02200 [Bacteroidia bacterium]
MSAAGQPFLTDGKPVGFHPELKQIHADNWWISIILFVSFLFLVVIRVFDFRKLNQLFTGFARAGAVNVIYREERSLTGRTSILLMFNFVLLAALFVWQVIIWKHDPDFGLLGYSKCLLIIALIYTVKIASTRFLGFLFEIREAALEYVYNIFLFNKTLGIILFPVTLSLAFAVQIPPQILIWTGGAIWSMVLIYRILRLVLLGFSTPGVSLYYLLLYICTLEIIPFVVLVKVLVGTF